MEQGVMISALAFGWAVLNTFYAWYSGNQRATKTELEDKLKESRSDVHALTLIVDAQGRDIATMKSELKREFSQVAVGCFRLAW
jgi:hypothetical protein